MRKSVEAKEEQFSCGCHFLLTGPMIVPIGQKDAGTLGLRRGVKIKGMYRRQLKRMSESLKEELVEPKPSKQQATKNESAAKNSSKHQ